MPPPAVIKHSDIGEREMRFIITAIQSIKGGEIKLDYDRIADSMGTSTKTAMNAWWSIRKNFALAFDTGDRDSTTPTKPKAPKAAKVTRKRKAADDDSGGARAETPAKKTKTPPKKAAKEVAAKEVAVKEEAVKEVAVKEEAVKEVAVKEVAVKKVAVKKVAVKEATVKKEAVKEETGGTDGADETGLFWPEPSANSPSP